MASTPRSAQAEREERRVNMRTLTVASAASAAAAAVTSQLWIAGTWIAAAVTPVLVALISEAMHRPAERIARTRPVERIARARTGERVGLRERPAPGKREHRGVPEPGPVRVYRQSSSRAPRRRLALGGVAATAAIAFVVAMVVITAGDLLAGDSIGRGNAKSTFLGGASGTEERDSTPDQEQAAPEARPGTEPGTQEDPATTDPPQDEPPAEDTTPTTPPADPPAGEPLPDAAPAP